MKNVFEARIEPCRLSGSSRGVTPCGVLFLELKLRLLERTVSTWRPLRVLGSRLTGGQDLFELNDNQEIRTADLWRVLTQTIYLQKKQPVLFPNFTVFVPEMSDSFRGDPIIWNSV